MADILILSRLQGAVQRNVNISQNTLVVQSLKVQAGVPAASELTQAILDKLILMQSVARADGKYNASSIVTSNTAVNYTPVSADVQAHLAAIDSALATAGSSSFSDTAFAITDNLDATKILKFEASGIATGITRTITMPNANVNLGDIAAHAANLANPHAVTKAQVGLGNADNTSDVNKPVSTAQADAIALKIDASQKGAVNGIASLDANGKLSPLQIPSLSIVSTSVVASQAAMLALSGAEAGDIAVRTDLSKTFILTASPPATLANWQELLTPTDAVSSVNGLTGTVVLSTSEIAEGTRLYFTAARAKAAAVADVITDGILDVAPSQNAVFDALALKSNVGHLHAIADVTGLQTALDGKEATITAGTIAQYWRGDKTFQTLNKASVGLANVDNTADAVKAVASSEATRATEVAGEIFTAAPFAVRYAQDLETLGRVMKADSNAASIDNFYVVGLVNQAAAVAGDISVVKYGKMIATAHGLTVGKPFYLSAAGALTSTAPTAIGLAVVRCGIVKDINTLDVSISTIGVN